MTDEERREYNREYHMKNKEKQKEKQAYEKAERDYYRAEQERVNADIGPDGKRPRGRPKKIVPFEDTLPKKRGRPPKNPPPVETRGRKPDTVGQENVNPGDNSRYLRHALVGVSLPPIDISDPVQVEQRISEYFQYCIDNDMKPNMVGMANWIGVSKRALDGWKRGEYGKSKTPIIERAAMVLEELWQDYMHDGKVNPASGIFLGKNMFGYRDVQDVQLAAVNPLGEMRDPAEIAQKYDYLVLDDGDTED